MQTSFHSAVSQYAKTDFPTSKANATKDFEVRQQDKNLLHTPTHPRKDNGAGTGENSNLATALTEKIDLKKLTDFIILVRSLYPQFRIAFTPHTYLEKHFTCCSKQHLDLFFSTVQTFTLLHNNSRKTEVENVLVTYEADYTAAFELWQSCQPKKQQNNYQPTVDKILYFLQSKYKGKTFTNLMIAVQLNHNADYVRRAFEELQQRKHIEKLENLKDKRESIYKLCA